MAESLPDPDTTVRDGHDATIGPGAGEPTGMPRWVKVLAIIALVVVVLLVIIVVTGGGPGEHGPGRHTSSGLESRLSPVVVTADAAQP